ncbi:MAG: hypothetical protein NTW03_22360 [Verrucomicrobia bacterium]|nr:hypothetical protein [Verrucomicrobiota bacterium]
MQRKQNILASVLTLASCAVLALCATPQAQAADASGTWSWSRPGRNGGDPVKTTLTLKVDGEKLTGTVTSPGRNGGDPVKTEISDGKIKGDEISFTVTRGQFSMKYSGKVTADAITGKTESERNGQAQSRDWTAKREK